MTTTYRPEIHGKGTWHLLRNKETNKYCIIAMSSEAGRADIIRETGEFGQFDYISNHSSKNNSKRQIAKQTGCGA